VLWLSYVLVFGCTGWFILGVVGTGLPPAHTLWIHARVPWPILGLLWAGGALTLASVARKPRGWAWVALGLQAPAVAFLSFYFLQASFLPDHSVALEVGENFPGYALSDQDGLLQQIDAGSPRQPALYVFYRGDW
jgi:hypothetical protein